MKSRFRSSIALRVFFCAGLLLGRGGTCAADPATKAFTGARIIDGTGGPAIENGMLVIKGDRILAVGPMGASGTVPPDAEVFDEKGMTIMPGLISAHSHLGLVKGSSTATAENYTRENVAAQVAQYEADGVTAVISLGVNRDALYEWRAEQRDGKMPGADIFTADRGLGAGGGVPPFPVPGDQVYRPRNAEEARADVREMAGRHPDLIKLWLDDMFGTLPKMAPEIFQAATDEAHQNGLRVAAHLFYLADAKALLSGGVDILAHSIRDKSVDNELIASMKARNVAYIPTLTLDESQFVYAQHPLWMDEPIFVESVDPVLLATWRSARYRAETANSPSSAKNKLAFATAMDNLRKLHQAGVFIAMGTDSGAMPTRVAGFAEHRELQLYVEAGLTPMEAIVAATAHSAAVIGQGSDRGTLEAGKRADFLVLEGNPLEDIRNTTHAAMIWHGGKAVVPLTKRPVSTAE